MTAEEEMRQLVEGLGMSETPEGIIDVHTLSDFDLVALHTTTGQELLRMRQLLHPRTEAGRALHSTHSSCEVEMRQRQLL